MPSTLLVGLKALEEEEEEVEVINEDMAGVASMMIMMEEMRGGRRWRDFSGMTDLDPSSPNCIQFFIWPLSLSGGRFRSFLALGLGWKVLLLDKEWRKREREERERRERTGKCEMETLTSSALSLSPLSDFQRGESQVRPSVVRSDVAKKLLFHQGNGVI